jgi:hypothetical protein
MPTFILLERVSALTPEVTQQIHSLRASGVISTQSIEAFTLLDIA